MSVGIDLDSGPFNYSEFYRYFNFHMHYLYFEVTISTMVSTFISIYI